LPSFKKEQIVVLEQEASCNHPISKDKFQLRKIEEEPSIENESNTHEEFSRMPELKERKQRRNISISINNQM
jgi:hypothetical protein